MFFYITDTEPRWVWKNDQVKRIFFQLVLSSKDDTINQYCDFKIESYDPVNKIMVEETLATQILVPPLCFAEITSPQLALNKNDSVIVELTTSPPAQNASTNVLIWFDIFGT